MIATAPTTNIRILSGVALAVIYVLGNMAMGLFGREIPFELNILIGAFILVQEGIDVTMWGIKRHTFKPEAYAGGVVREAVNPPPVPPGAAAAPPATPLERPSDGVPDGISGLPVNIERELPTQAHRRADAPLTRDD